VKGDKEKRSRGSDFTRVDMVVWCSRGGGRCRARADQFWLDGVVCGPEEGLLLPVNDVVHVLHVKPVTPITQFVCSRWGPG
jgi:hypothetical protein